MIDAHLHNSDGMLDILIKSKIHAIINIQNKQQYDAIYNISRENTHIYTSIGIHPCDSEKISFEEMLPYLQQASIIGEIGMDCWWCNSDYNKQKEIFIKQLEYAMNNHKPVIIHIGGYEDEIYELLQKYPNRYLIHWVKKDLLHLLDYIKAGYYCSIGPDFDEDVIKQIPNDLLLMESDGVVSLTWLDESLNINDYEEVMNKGYQKIARIKDINNLDEVLINNLNRFIKG